VSLGARILSFLRPHALVLSGAVVATACFAVMDASVYVLLIPFVETLFVSGGAAARASDGSGMDRLLDATIHRWVDVSGAPLVAITRISVLILVAFAVKNVFHFARAVLLARAAQGLKRHFRNVTSDHLVGLDLGISLPFLDCGAFFPGWEASPPDARSLWDLVERISADDPHLAASTFVAHPQASAYFRRQGGLQGEHFGCDGAGHGRGRFRVTELRQADQGCKPYSNFNLVGAAQVGKSSLTGMRVPRWAQAVELCLDAATAFPGIRTQSWDVALTAAGPVLLELNFGGDLNLHQLAHRRGMLRRSFTDHLRRCGYKGRLPQ